jgi:Xaa-Pro aminopeptidase
LDSIKPGVTFEEVTKSAHDLISAEGYTWLAPATQHIGLDITESAYMIKGTPERFKRVPRPMDTRPFKPGMVIVNQPNVVTQDRQMGAMVIDTVIVTRDGCKVVSKSPLHFAQV